MKKKAPHFKVNRRAFMGRSIGTALGLGPVAATLTQLRLMDSAVANSSGMNLGDYKALVCLFLAGGTDMNNFLIPIGGNPQAGAYKNDRGIAGQPRTIAEATALQATHGLAAVPPSIESEGTGINVPGAAGQWGLHPSCPHMAGMFNSSDLAILSNLSTLEVPTTRANYFDVPKPTQLFSHSDQTTEWMAGSTPAAPFTSGWGGKIADLLHTTSNPDSLASMLMTIAGNNDFMVAPGGSVPQYALTTIGSVSLSGYGANYSAALTDPNDPLSYIPNNFNATRLKHFQNIMNYTHSNVIEESYNTVVRRARASEGLVGAALAVANTPLHPSLTFQNGNPVPLYDGVFFDIHGVTTDDTNDLNTLIRRLPNMSEELLMIVKMIAGRDCVGNNRQIFFCNLGGWDNHASINLNQPGLLSQVDNGVYAFQECMNELEVQDAAFTPDQVTAFQASEFNRTWTPNGPDYSNNGTDHAWGTNCFMFGGAVNGGDLYGTVPTLAVAGPDDVPQGNRGRWIPTTALDQSYARLAKWFGVPSADLDTIFPNLEEFPDPFTSGNLDFIPMV